MSEVNAQSSKPNALPRVNGTLSFIVPQETKPVFHSTALTGGEAKLFFEIEDVEVEVADMRAIKDKLSIDRELEQRSTGIPLKNTELTPWKNHTHTRDCSFAQIFQVVRVITLPTHSRCGIAGGLGNCLPL